MHRSGTSCLTGSLQQAGLQLGKYHSWNRFNQKGNRENQDIVDFHESLLAANNASWENPPSRLRYTDADVARARELIETYRAAEPWGFKDPRALLALDVWRAAAPGIQFIGVYRHPRAVAESVTQRSGGQITLEQSLDLWVTYNRLLYKAWSHDPFPVLCFDWDETEFHRRLEPVIEFLELPGVPEGETFYSPELRHYEGRSWEGVPWRAKRLYRKLSAAADTPLRQVSVAADGQS